jgi:hypothetical protein
MRLTPPRPIPLRPAGAALRPHGQGIFGGGFLLAEVALGDNAIVLLRLLQIHFGTTLADTLTRALVALAEREGLQALAADIEAEDGPRHGNSRTECCHGGAL